MMAPLQGATLGERHRYYNELLDKALKTNTKDVPKINYDDDDVDNMLRIDIVCHNRDVDYILEVFKCDDMLYVTRALKYSTWLITEDQYSYIINPEYLHNKLFPEMMAKAITKLMLHIRRYLKDEIRLKDFYIYVNKNNPKQALKWLPNCSTTLIEEIVPEHTKEMNLSVIKRIGRKSADLLKEMVKITEKFGSTTSFHKSVLFLRSHFDDFLDVLEVTYRAPSLTAKTTEVIMKKRPDRIINNFRKYFNIVHLPTFVKFINRENTKQFLMTNINSCYINFENLKPFVNKIPRDDVLHFLKELFGVASDIKTDGDNRSDAEALFNAVERDNKTFKNVYRWYEFAPFDVAFRDLKKMICAESSAEERHSMLITLLKCCGKNLDQGKTVIKYYHNKHINEPYLHKINFINALLEQYDVFRFDDDLWTTLNELFHSLEVYIESTNKVQKCLQSIILYKILRDETVPEIVEQKLEYNSLKCYKNKIDNNEKEKVFEYLYKHFLKKINNQTLGSETSMKEAVSVLSNLWTLIEDWKKQAVYHEFVTNKVIELSDINKKNSWNNDMKHLYLMVKPYQKPLLDRSLLLKPHEDSIINILRHDTEGLEKYEETVISFCYNDKISLKRVLRKLRIYWAESLREQWSDLFINKLDKTAGHKTFVRGILVLSGRSEILDFIRKYAPSENKINWKEDNEVTISLRKHIAKSMHLCRPQLPAEVVLLYAKGDYLQYTVFSLNTIYYNLRTIDIEKYIRALLNAPVSLRKHGIRLAFSKLKTEESLTISQNIWKCTKNSSIRVTIFQLLFDTLCKETSLVASIWKVLQSFIDNLQQDENKIIYKLLGCHIESVPISVVGEFYQKSFLLLKSLRHKPECNDFLDKLIRGAKKCIEYLDKDFVENSLLSYKGMHNMLSDHNYVYLDILAAYLLYSKDENIQMQKYNHLITPVLEKCGPQWVYDREMNVLEGLRKLFIDIGERFDKVFQNKLIIPVKMFQNIEQTIVKYLSNTEYYTTITYWKLIVAFIKLLDEMNSNPDSDYSWEDIKNECMEPYARICVECLRNDVKEKFPSIYILFSQALEQTFPTLDIKDKELLHLLYTMLECKDLQVYLTVLKHDDYVLSDEIQRKIFEFTSISEELKYYYFTKYNVKYNIDDGQDQRSDTISDDDEDQLPSSSADSTGESTSSSSTDVDDDDDGSENTDDENSISNKEEKVDKND